MGAFPSMVSERTVEGRFRPRLVEGVSQSPVSRGLKLVAGSRNSPEGCSILRSSSRADSVYRCVPAGVGGASRSLLGVTSMDYGGTGSPYQPAGVLSGFSSSTEALSGSVGLCSFHNVRQLHGGGFSKELGRVLVPSPCRFLQGKFSGGVRAFPSHYVPCSFQDVTIRLQTFSVGNQWVLSGPYTQRCAGLSSRYLVDLFATALTRRLPLYVSPLPDQAAWKQDAFFFLWEGLDLYAFPPFALIHRVLVRVRDSQCVRMTLVAPLWPQADWFPLLLDLLVDSP